MVAVLDKVVEAEVRIVVGEIGAAQERVTALGLADIRRAIINQLLPNRFQWESDGRAIEIGRQRRGDAPLHHQILILTFSYFLKY